MLIGPFRMLGIVLILLAAGLGYLGYQESQEVGAQLSSAFSGEPTDNVMYYYIGAVAVFVAGWWLVK